MDECSHEWGKDIALTVSSVVNLISIQNYLRSCSCNEIRKTLNKLGELEEELLENPHRRK